MDHENEMKELWKQPHHIARLLHLPKKMTLSVDVQRSVEKVMFPSRNSEAHLAQNSQGLDFSAIHDASVIESLLSAGVAEKKTWEHLGVLWERLYELDKTALCAARYCESAFLYASEEQWLQLSKSFCLSQPQFYSQLHIHVRHALISQSRGYEEIQSYILSHLMRSRHSKWLSPLERIAVFAGLYEAPDPQVAWDFYCQWEHCLLPVPEPSQLPEELLRLMVARLAMRVGELIKAREVLAPIASDHPYYSMAQELTGGEQAAQSVEHDQRWQQWFHLGTWELQIQGLQNWLQEARTDKQIRSFLTQLIPDLGQYFEKDPIVWHELSKVLAGSDALEYVDIFAFHSTQERVVHDSAIEFALWRPLMSENVPPRWHAMALMHDFLASGGERVESLWQSTRIFKRCDFDLWRQVQHWALQWSQTEGILTESQRLKFKQLLHGLAFEDHREAQPLEVLLRSQDLSLVVLYGLVQSIREARISGFEPVLCLVLRLISKEKELESERLNLLWQSTYKTQPGVAWRVATVLYGRGELPKKVEPFWQGSGEKRDRYPVLNPAPNHVDRCFFGMSTSSSRLVWSLLRVGPLLPELLVSMDPQLKIVKKKRTEREKQFDKHLSAVQWLGKPRVRVVSEQRPESPPVPGFCKSLQPTFWAEMCAYIVDAMGLNHWGWSLERLCSAMEQLLPQSRANYSNKSRDPRLTKWMRGLAPEQKAAWHDLTALVRRVEEKEGAIALATFVVRLATLIYPAHAEALQSLRKMEAPPDVIWGLENWLLSEEYAKTRSEQGLETHCPIPENLSTLTIG